MPTKTPSTKVKKPAAKAAGKAPAKSGVKSDAKADAKDELDDDESTPGAKVDAKSADPKADAKNKRSPKAAAKPGAARQDGDGDGESDEEDDDDEEFVPKKAAAGTKPAAEPTAVVPARRLTPEAKAQINAMVAKGVPLDEALRRAASWETFVAPVKDDTQKAFPGKDGAGPRSPFGGRRPSGPRDKSELPPREPNSGGGTGFGFEDEDPGLSLSDDEPIVAGGDDD